MLKAATLPRISRNTGKRGSNPVNMSTGQPAMSSVRTASPKLPASVSGSVRGRSMSLPPAAMLTRSGAIAMACGICSAATSLGHGDIDHPGVAGLAAALGESLAFQPRDELGHGRLRHLLVGGQLRQPARPVTGQPGQGEC